MPRSAPLFLGLSVCLLGVVLAAPAMANGILVRPDDGPQAVGRSGPVILRGHRVAATIDDRLAEVTVEQVFRNTSAGQLEGTYLFPLPEGAIVSRFAMTMGGKMVEGEVVEANQARAVYESIVRRRRDPGLLEYVGRGLFRARVFPILPRQDLTIRLTYQQVLAEDQGVLEFRYPLATDRFQNAPIQDTVVDVSMASAVDLKGIYSGSHAIDLTRDGDRKARASYESSRRRQNRDFVLYIARSPADVGFSLLSHRRVGEDGTFMAVIAPRVEITDEDRAPKDIVYVLDTSGSMEGEKLEQAARSLQYGIQRLHRNDRFNVVAFSTTTRTFRDAFLPATAEIKKAAVDWVGALQAGGGTNIQQALLEAFALRSRDRLSIVVFLTDGLPTVGERRAGKIVDAVKTANDHGARVFTFGVGHDLDVKLLDRIAATTRGARDYVQPGEDIEIPTSRFFRKVDRPVLSGVKVDLGPGIHDVYPPDVGDLFAGEQVVVFGRYTEPGERTVTLTGRVGEREVTHTYVAGLRAGEGPGFLPRLWAHRKVAFLLDEIRLNGRDPELVDEIVKLATRHAIVTPFTAGLVVEKHELAGAEPVIRDGAVADHVRTDNDLPYEEGIGENGISDAPFTGPAPNGLIGLGGGAGGAFGGRGGSRDLGRGGAAPRWETALEGALAWLAAHQSPNGGWDADGFDRWCKGRSNAGERPDGPAGAMSDIRVTGLALQAFLGAGYTNRGRHRYARCVSKGLRYLKNQQDAEGCFGPRLDPSFLLGHAAAALAMVEALGMTGSPIYRGSAQKSLDFLALARNPHGVWGRGVKTGDQDVVITGYLTLPVWSAMLINAEAARRGVVAPLRVDPDIAPAVIAFFDRQTDPDSGRVAGGDGLGELPTALGLLCRHLAGEDPRRSEVMKKQAELLAAAPPVWRADGTGVDLPTWQMTTLALFQQGGSPWKAWWGPLQGALANHRRTDGKVCAHRGSWDPLGLAGEEGGRVYATALGALCMQVLNRYDRGAGAMAAATPVVVPAQTPAPAPQSVADQTKDSEAIRDLKADASGTAAEGADGLDGVRARIRHVADRAFALHRDGRWVDTAWDGASEPTVIDAYSDAYFALLAKAPVVGRYLALGERVVFVHEGTAYEVVPASQEAGPDR